MNIQIRQYSNRIYCRQTKCKYKVQFFNRDIFINWIAFLMKPNIIMLKTTMTTTKCWPFTWPFFTGIPTGVFLLNLIILILLAIYSKWSACILHSIYSHLLKESNCIKPPTQFPFSMRIANDTKENQSNKSMLFSNFNINNMQIHDIKKTLISIRHVIYNLIWVKSVTHRHTERENERTQTSKSQTKIIVISLIVFFFLFLQWHKNFEGIKQFSLNHSITQWTKAKKVAQNVTIDTYTHTHSQLQTAKEGHILTHTAHKMTDRV